MSLRLVIEWLENNVKAKYKYLMRGEGCMTAKTFFSIWPVSFLDQIFLNMAELQPAGSIQHHKWFPCEVVLGYLSQLYPSPSKFFLFTL